VKSKYTFKNYAEKSPEEDLLCLFDRWAELNNIYGVEKQEKKKQ